MKMREMYKEQCKKMLENLSGFEKVLLSLRLEMIIENYKLRNKKKHVRYVHILKSLLTN